MTDNAYRQFQAKYKTGPERRAALERMSAAEIDQIARGCPNHAGRAAIAAYKSKNRRLKR